MIPLFILENDGGINNDRRRGINFLRILKLFVQGRSVDQRFKCGARLPPGLDGPVELGLSKIAPANHGFDQSGFSFNAHQG